MENSKLSAMEFCGAFHFGQWSHVYSDAKHQPSPVADFEDNASQEHFGHPYAFIGETYSRFGLLRSYGNLQSYWTTTKLWKLTVVLDYYGAMETYSRIGLLRSYGNLQSYWTIDTFPLILNNVCERIEYKK